eukprot:gnl/TRDRNA2_/TRDRNA2_153283_c0_seq2.p1 gnl/TRDRNA2_/TRDRNA2_153283_c0~~gnl/TRDRNA2_/TRDRNA2_153283_c0_seq2.p1  ORF type:complete len:275 (-),score=23.32 gnl/TRDRNA2_/TRDRNA2_153283_c0_seq2:5-829(-)
MTDLWVIGILLEISAGIFGTIGKQLVSFSARSSKPRIANLCFISGICITTFVGPILDASAFGFADQSVVAPLGSLDVCWNTLLAPYTLGEKIRRAHISGTVLIATGAALTAIFGPQSDHVATVSDISSTFLRWPVLVYAAGFVLFCTVCIILILTRPAGVGDKMRGAALGALAGGLAGNMYFCTCTMRLLRHAIGDGDWSAWRQVIPYALILAMLAVALGNTPIMAKGLLEYEAVFIVPWLLGCHICVACISGAMVLDELHGEYSTHRDLRVRP